MNLKEAFRFQNRLQELMQEAMMILSDEDNTTINFDRNKIRTYANRLSRQADQVSTEIDRCLINSEVPYEPPFDVNDSFGVVFETVLTAGKHKERARPSVGPSRTK